MHNSVKNPALDFFKIFVENGNAGAEVQQRINDLIPAIIYIYDASNGKISFINKKVTDILGYEFEEINNRDDHISYLVFKDDAALVERELEKFLSLKDDETYSYKSRLNHKEGNWKYFRTTGSVLKRNDNGDAEIFLVIAEDITHTIETEEEVQVKKELISETEELLQFGTWSWEAATNKLEWSNGIYNLLGHTRDDAEATVEFYLKYISLDDINILVEKVKQSITALTGFEHIYNLTTKAGQQKIVCTNGKVVLSHAGQLIKIIGTTRDVTEQISAYRELFYYKQMTLEKEKFLESGSWEIDLATGKINWSDGMYRLFEYDLQADSTVPGPSEEFYYSHFSDEEIKRSREDWEKALKDKDNYVREETITAKNGLRKWLETYGKVIRDNDGAPVKVMGATKDISRLKDYERQLEKRLLELERSNKGLEEFAYVASHDLQEPLRKISTFSERLKLKFENELADEGKGYITRILSAAANMRMLIESLLNFSRLSKSVEYEKVDINHLLDEVVTELELQVDESHATVLKQNLPVLEVIPSQIKQLFGNIISNAIKFRKPNVAPVIEVKCAPLAQQEKENHFFRRDIQYYVISIRDNGIGFEQEYAEKIFQIFQRLHGKSEYPGAGIGLAICKKIAENHHGKLFAQGNPGDGAVFTVILPEKNS